MSRKGLKILLDTSFILPVLGFKTNDIIMNTLPLLRSCEAYYSDLSILEAMWKISKIAKEREQVRVILEGAELLRATFKHAGIDGKAIEIAIGLYQRGHRDLIDAMLYGISVSSGLKLLTIDKELRSFIKSNGLEDILLHPEELAKALGS